MGGDPGGDGGDMSPPTLRQGGTNIVLSPPTFHVHYALHVDNVSLNNNIFERFLVQKYICWNLCVFYFRYDLNVTEVICHVFTFIFIITRFLSNIYLYLVMCSDLLFYFVKYQFTARIKDPYSAYPFHLKLMLFISSLFVLKFCLKTQDCLYIFFKNTDSEVQYPRKI